MGSVTYGITGLAKEEEMHKERATLHSQTATACSYGREARENIPKKDVRAQHDSPRAGSVKKELGRPVVEKLLVQYEDVKQTDEKEPNS